MALGLQRCAFRRIAQCLLPVYRKHYAFQRDNITTMADSKAPAARPLSPHLQIYRPMLTTMMSIAHRITGAALYFGTGLVAWWLLAAASGPDSFATFQAVAGSPIGLLVLFGYTFALMHHMLGGLRHFIWDTGRGLGHPMREWLARGTIAGSLVLTILIWAIGLSVGGA